MDALVERLQLDESQLLGKDGLSEDHYEEEDGDKEQVKKEYFSEEENRKEEREKRINDGKYVRQPKEAKPSKPPKIKQIGIGKPLWDQEERGIVEQVPEPEVLEEVEDKITSLKEAFDILSEDDKTKLISLLLKKKGIKVK